MSSVAPAGTQEPLHSTRGMAIGTIASRGTGFLRTLVIGAAIGKVVGDAYNAANTIPNSIYDLVMGGVLGAVVIPLLVAAARRDSDGGESYAQKLLTVIVVGLAAATIAVVLLAPSIAHLYVGGGAHGAVRARRAELATLFARFFLPQIFFYGVGAVFGAILNVRGSFARPMWAPVLNNIVVIVTGVVFIAMTRTAQVEAGLLTPTQQLVLALGTTLGIVAQTVALLPALRAVGFRFRLRWDVRGVGLSRAARLAGWTFVYVLANQIAYLIIVRLASASRYVGAYTVYSYAFTLALLPYAVVAVSVITALMPQMSASAVDGRLGDVGVDLARGLKLSAVVLVPASFAAFALGPLAGAVLFAHRALSLSTGRLIGATLAAYAVGLVPFSAFQLQLRAFYAMADTRTPALVNIVLAVINIAADVVLFVVLPAREQVVGLALGSSISYIAGFAWLGALLRRRLGAPPGLHVTRSMVRLSVAAALATVAAYAAARIVTGIAGLGVRGSLLGLIVGVGLGTPLYVGMARRMRVPEVREIALLARAPWSAGRPAQGRGSTRPPRR